MDSSGKIARRVVAVVKRAVAVAEAAVVAVVVVGIAQNHVGIVVEMTSDASQPQVALRPALCGGDHHNVVFGSLYTESYAEFALRHIGGAVGNKRRPQLRIFNLQESHRVVDTLGSIGIHNNNLEVGIILRHHQRDV